MNKSVTRVQLASKIATKHGISEREASDFIFLTFLAIKIGIKRFVGSEVKIPNFGVFYMDHKNERLGRNPNTLKPYKISERNVAKVRYSKKLRARIHQKELENEKK